MKNTIHRAVADPTLTRYAAALANVRFEYSDASLRHLYEVSQECNLRNVSLFQDRKTYRVRLYLGGAQRTIGITSKLCDAARYADMAVLFFWPHRIRRGCPPNETDMNFSLEQAQSDLDTNTPAKEILDAILEHLVTFGHLPDAAQANAERVAKRTDRDRRRTVRGEFMQVCSDLQSEIAGLREQLARIENKLDTRGPIGNTTGV